MQKTQKSPSKTSKQEVTYEINKTI